MHQFVVLPEDSGFCGFPCIYVECGLTREKVLSEGQKHLSAARRWIGTRRWKAWSAKHQSRSLARQIEYAELRSCTNLTSTSKNSSSTSSPPVARYSLRGTYVPISRLAIYRPVLYIGQTRHGFVFFVPMHSMMRDTYCMSLLQNRCRPPSSSPSSSPSFLLFFHSFHSPITI